MKNKQLIVALTNARELAAKTCARADQAHVEYLEWEVREMADRLGIPDALTDDMGRVLDRLADNFPELFKA